MSVEVLESLQKITEEKRKRQEEWYEKNKKLLDQWGFSKQQALKNRQYIEPIINDFKSTIQNQIYWGAVPCLMTVGCLFILHELTVGNLIKAFELIGNTIGFLGVFYTLFGHLFNLKSLVSHVDELKNVNLPNFSIRTLTSVNPEQEIIKGINKYTEKLNKWLVNFSEIFRKIKREDSKKELRQSAAMVIGFAFIGTGFLIQMILAFL